MAEEARVRFVLETSEAKKAVTSFRRDLTDAGRAAGKLGALAGRALASAVKQGTALLASPVVGAVGGALAQQGATASGAGLAAAQAVGQTAQQQGQQTLAEGLREGDLGKVAGGTVATALGIAESQALGPVRAAREAGIAQAAAVTQPFAAAGVDLDPSVQADIFKVAFMQAFRSIQNEAQARRGSPNLAELLKLVGAEGGF
jgi:hypothetical protein